LTLPEILNLLSLRQWESLLFYCLFLFEVLGIVQRMIILVWFVLMLFVFSSSCFPLKEINCFFSQKKTSSKYSKHVEDFFPRKRILQTT